MSVLDKQNLKRCSMCKATKPFTDFYELKSGGHNRRCKSCGQSYNKTYRASHECKREPYTEQVRARNAKWASDNPKKMASYRKKWYVANRDRFSTYRRNRVALLKGADGTHSAEEIRTLYKRQRGTCAACCRALNGVYDVDHIVPLSKGGSNWISNIQLLCPRCNGAKHAKDPILFMQSIGRLL